MDALGADRAHGERGSERRVDAPGESEDEPRAAGILDPVAQAVSTPSTRTSSDTVPAVSSDTLGKVTVGPVTVTMPAVRPLTRSSSRVPIGALVATWTL